MGLHFFLLEHHGTFCTLTIAVFELWIMVFELFLVSIYHKGYRIFSI
jgi:hypothetical protein